MESYFMISTRIISVQS